MDRIDVNVVVCVVCDKCNQYIKHCDIHNFTDDKKLSAEGCRSNHADVGPGIGGFCFINNEIFVTTGRFLHKHLLCEVGVSFPMSMNSQIGI